MERDPNRDLSRTIVSRLLLDCAVTAHDRLRGRPDVSMTDRNTVVTAGSVRYVVRRDGAELAMPLADVGDDERACQIRINYHAHTGYTDRLRHVSLDVRADWYAGDPRPPQNRTIVRFEIEGIDDDVHEVIESLRRELVALDHLVEGSNGNA